MKLFALLTLLATVVLVGCSNEPSTPPPPADTNPPAAPATTNVPAAPAPAAPAAPAK